ncbi:hypothetical protein MKW98_026703 [Papaver atlanticum]|uniref:DUF3444 domain-containing protein n=1 Tax=Papaver atlanticum TaxID=357466 RepID=A0AAD4RZP6_9MAGN|nr:hypothetical protein MKW98_026703 [Papaver atlanticum]
MSNGGYKNPNEEKRAAEASGRPPNKSKATCVSDSEKNAAVDAKEMSPEVVNIIPGSMDEGISSSPSSLNFFEMLGTELCNFDEERSCEKFKTGQIWDVYCKLDKLPKNYAQIVGVESFPVFKLAVK